MDYVFSNPVKSRVWIKEVSLGNFLLLLSILGAIAAGIWEGGMIRATLQDSIETERDLRRADTAMLVGRLDLLQSDMREVRARLMTKDVGHD